MTRRLVVRGEAESEITKAAEWYDERSLGLSAEFLRAVDACVAAVMRSPLLYPVVGNEMRRCLLRRFPYALIYNVSADEIVVLACVHCRRDPRGWQSRQ